MYNISIKRQQFRLASVAVKNQNYTVSFYGIFYQNLAEARKDKKKSVYFSEKKIILTLIT